MISALPSPPSLATQIPEMKYLVLKLTWTILIWENRPDKFNFIKKSTLPDDIAVKYPAAGSSAERETIS